MKRATTAPETSTTPAIPTPAPLEHVKDPILAQALFAVWSGDPAVVIGSPPGAGKTHLITRLAHQLSTRAGMTVAIAAQTRAQAADVANRTAETGVATTLVGSRVQAERPRGRAPSVSVLPFDKAKAIGGVVVATTARWLWMPWHRTLHFDVLLIDEAYQLTFADLGGLGSLADQFVLVGDPGQIAPVVTGSSRRWESWSSGPHVPAPDALIAAHAGNVTALRLPQTWRLGPETTALLSPPYPNLPFSSARLPRHIELGGQRLPEFGATPLPITAGTADPAVIAAISSHVRHLLTDGNACTPDGTRALTAADIAVIAPHVEQTALIAAALADHPDLFVGTINQAQGLQREAVIAVHPLLGHEADEDFALDLGRLCVALSRHQSRLDVVFDQRTPSMLTEAHAMHPHRQRLAIHRQILETLAA